MDFLGEYSCIVHITERSVLVSAEVMIFSKFYSVLVRYLAVLHSPCAGHISLEGEIMLGKWSRVDHFAPKVLGNEGLVLVGGDDQVREGIEMESTVEVPVHRAGVER